MGANRHMVFLNTPELEDGLSRRSIVKSVDHPDFQRLCALQNWAGKTKHQQFLVKGGRQIEAALRAGHPVLEIWVPEQATLSLA